MFYNSFRSTKSSMNSPNKNSLSTGKKIINHRQRLLNLQKRQKLRDLLITKFMMKYGIKNAEELLQDEISKFLEGEKFAVGVIIVGVLATLFHSTVLAPIVLVGIVLLAFSLLSRGNFSHKIESIEKICFIITFLAIVCSFILLYKPI